MATASNVRGFKQTNGYFVPLANCATSTVILNYTGGSGAGGSYVPGAFTGAPWAAGGTGSAGAVLSTIASVGAGGLLKDMGKTVVSSNRTFRKVQLVGRAAGQSASLTSSGPFFTGYIELATGLNGAEGAAPAPVAYLPGLM